MKKHCILLFTLLASSFTFLAPAQNRLVSVTYEKVLTIHDQFEAMFKDFGDGFDQKDTASAWKFAKKIQRIGQEVCFVCLNYRTEDPDGKEVIASGLLALPQKRIKGVINITPFCREKSWSPSINKWTPECMLSMIGYAVLVPDTIGYGATADEVVALLLNDNTALVSVHFRQAVEEYLATLEKPRKLPSNTTFFGYSLGAAGALATAAWYHAHPELKVKPYKVYLGSGAYDPALTIESSIEYGESDYLLYPAIARSLNRWKGMHLDSTLLFKGAVLQDFDYIASCVPNMTELANVYGKDLHTYLHPDWFTEHRNPEIIRLMDFIKTLKITVTRDMLPRGTKIYLRHSAEDRYVPVVCSDILRKDLRRNGYTNVKYIRPKTGDHVGQGAAAVYDLFLLSF